MQKRFTVAHSDAFPNGTYLKGEVEKVLDFDVPTKKGEERPQAKDRDTGLPLWQATVLDADEEAGKRETALSVKFAAKVQPVPPENKTPFPWTPVEFTGLTALPYAEYTGTKDKDGKDRVRIAWSFRAEGMTEPSGSVAGSAAGSSGKAGA
jgi:hypothetical protein